MTMRHHYQNGFVRRAKRKGGPDVWEYLYWEMDSEGNRIRRNKRIGTVDEYPTKEAASNAVNGFRMKINEDSYRLQLRPVSIAQLVSHFLETVLLANCGGYSESTKRLLPDLIARWILPRWGSTNIRDVRARDIQSWLTDLRRKDGEPLADPTKAKIRNVYRRLFSHAIQNDWLEKGVNVIKLVKQSAKRRKDPVPLTSSEIRRLIDRLESPYRELVMLALFCGLRRSELFGLQWRDFDFDRNRVNITRNICYGKIGSCKTEASRATLPLPRSVAVALCVWRKFTPWNKPTDWVFASSRNQGAQPLDCGCAMADVIKPAAVAAGITKRIHWHLFRHTFGSRLIEKGADIAVVHELMRHASPRTTLEFYIRARRKLKIRAQQGIDSMLFPGAEDSFDKVENRGVPADIRERQQRDAVARLETCISETEDIPKDLSPSPERTDDNDSLM